MYFGNFPLARLPMGWGWVFKHNWVSRRNRKTFRRWTHTCRETDTYRQTQSHKQKIRQIGETAGGGGGL